MAKERKRHRQGVLCKCGTTLNCIMVHKYGVPAKIKDYYWCPECEKIYKVKLKEVV